MEDLNPPARVRAIIYVIIVLGTAVLVPLHLAGNISDTLFTVWSSVAGASALLARLNVSL